jgi:hypothetical protein
MPWPRNKYPSKADQYEKREKGKKRKEMKGKSRSCTPVGEMI